MDNSAWESRDHGSLRLQTPLAPPSPSPLLKAGSGSACGPGTPSGALWMCPRMKTPRTLQATSSSVWETTWEKRLYRCLNGISWISGCPHRPWSCHQTPLERVWCSLLPIQGDGTPRSSLLKAEQPPARHRASPEHLQLWGPAVPAPRALRS